MAAPSVCSRCECVCVHCCVCVHLRWVNAEHEFPYLIKHQTQRENTNTNKCKHKHTHTHTHTHTHAHTHTHIHMLVFMVYGVFILYKLYVLLPYTYPTPKLSLHRRRCISTFPPKNAHCMIYKHLKLWGHWKCPHKSPSPCNTYVIPMSLYKFVSS